MERFKAALGWYRLFSRWLQAPRNGALVVGGCFTLLAGVVSFVPIAWSWQEGWDLDALFWARGQRPAPDNVVLIPIGSQAGSSLFLPERHEDFQRCRDVRLDGPLPGYKNPDPASVLTRWPRCLHARALDALALAQPEAIVMDISFRPRSDPSGVYGVYSEQDRVLAESMRRAGKVLLALKISIDREPHEQAQPVVREIEAAALALAPFLLLESQAERANKFCTFKEDSGWVGPCLPTVAHQVASLKVYPEFRALLERAAAKNVDLMPAREKLLADRFLQAPVGLIRNVATADERTAKRVRDLLPSEDSIGALDARRLRSLTDIYLGPGIRYFNFYGRPGKAFQTLRYEALVAGDEAARPSAGSLRGKVVFIGFAEHFKPESSEHFSTPFTTDKKIKLSGVELAATAYANLQDGTAIEPVSDDVRALIALVLGILCTLVGLALLPRRFVLGCLALLTLGSAYFVVALMIFEQYALWLPITPLGFDVIAGFAAGVVELTRQRTEADRLKAEAESRRIEAERQRAEAERQRAEAERQRAEAERQRANIERELARVRDVLGKLHPPRLVESFIKYYEKLAELRETVYGACVFVDIERYTPKAASEPVEEVPEILNANFRSLLPVIEKHGGEPINYAGDAIISVWRTAAPDTSLRRRACVACLELLEAAEEFMLMSPKVALRIRIGVDFGLMVMCMVGGGSHMEWLAVGDVPNTASRLQELNKQLQTRLLVSKLVMRGLDGRDGILARYVGHFQLRGKEPSTDNVYQLINERIRATSEQLELCEKFSVALNSYQTGRHGEARERFAELLQQYPGDGPSSFYAQLCAEHRYYGQAAIPQKELIYN